ncbi:outer membrane lipoprotein carrier protein LolA [Avibacterium sp. 21-599]|uniref:outer membrane lipoprotein carrier protein LolA n=1 Tax=Avibacterium sp. 21-599 TaxID=2911528 RepID=UPI00224564B2|nr:outer membrane lipoprotein carrier protein LolA [Avibacterium sp. 21-599]MCW9717221.1 outer membrane lipoprotein carrier protein LolA [Avibacterium sp. 21-599]
MKKYFALLLWIVSLPLWAFSEQDLIAQLQQSHTVQGDFVQQRFLKALPQPIETKGNFTLVAEKGLLWQMTQPFRTELRITPQGIAQWNGQGWVANGNMAQSQQIRLFLGLLSGDLSGLKSHFDFALSGNAKQWTLQLTPNSLLMKQIFTSIIVQGNQSVTAMQLNEVQGDSTKIYFQHIQLNQPLSSAVKQALE